MRDTILFLAVFLLGCGIVGLGGVAVLWIWRDPEPSPPPFSAAEFVASTVLFIHRPKTLRATNRPHPYNWQTREPMIWGRS